MRVGRGVIVTVIGMIVVRVIRVIMGSVRLRWWMAINMIVILTIWKSLRSVWELENAQAKGSIRESGRRRPVVVGGRDKPHSSGL